MPDYQCGLPLQVAEALQVSSAEKKRPHKKSQERRSRGARYFAKFRHDEAELRCAQHHVCPAARDLWRRYDY
jgi:hypothetical protein